MCEHIVFECHAYDEHQAIITKGAPDHQLQLFGVKAGIDALADCQEKKQGILKTKDPSEPIGDPGYTSKQNTTQSVHIKHTTGQRTLETIPVDVL